MRLLNVLDYYVVYVPGPTLKGRRYFPLTILCFNVFVVEGLLVWLAISILYLSLKFFIEEVRREVSFPRVEQRDENWFLLVEPTSHDDAEKDFVTNGPYVVHGDEG